MINVLKEIFPYLLYPLGNYDFFFLPKFLKMYVPIEVSLHIQLAFHFNWMLGLRYLYMRYKEPFSCTVSRLMTDNCSFSITTLNR